MTRRIITWSFYVLFFFTPLFFTSNTSELFEFNKMILVYILTIIITGTWLFKMVAEKKLLIKRTILDIPLLLFLASQILSTIFSMDPHTSIWGYYSRSNGGLLSTISYISLYFVIVSMFDLKQVLRFFKAAILGGVLVSLWAIPEHFGVDPSCVMLVHQFDATCWVQDVQARVFATLGQPNWLAAYLEMLIFPAIYFFIRSKTNLSRAYYLTALILFYLAFTFTYSRGALLGLIGGVVILVLVYFSPLVEKIVASKKTADWPIKPLLIALSVLILINVLFGSALTGSFALVKQSAAPARPGITTAPSSETQLENGGTESGEIRLIVWKGALDIFLHYPIFGSGVETFAYSYYNFRPVAHNLTSEWDYLYNKAHNEYLNYLATTGLVGFLSYMLVITVFIYGSLRQIFRKNTNQPILIACILASYVAYLIQNFFGFSVVIIAVFFFVFPGLTIAMSEDLKFLTLPKSNFLTKFAKNTIYRKPFFTVGTQVVLVALMVLFIFSICEFWLADTFYAVGQNETDLGALETAIFLHGNEPLYHSELGYTAAAAAAGEASNDATYSGQLKDLAVLETDDVLTKHPQNVSLWRTAIRTYYVLSTIDPTYAQKTIDTFDKTIALAPTDPKLVYNKGLFLEIMNKNPEAQTSLEKAVALKPNYEDAIFALGDLYQSTSQYSKAASEYQSILSQIPNEPQALQKLKVTEASEAAQPK